MTDSVSISPARMAAACRKDARRVVFIAAPLFTAGFLLEAASHAGDPNTRMLIQPLLSAGACAGVLIFGRRVLRRFPYPELVLLVLWGLVMWSIAMHVASEQPSTRASTLVMLAVASVGSATLIMPAAAATLTIGATIALYGYVQTVATGEAGLPALVAPALVLMVAVSIYRSRRSAIRSVEALRERVARDQQQLEQVNEQLRNLSISDPLTGALNRRGFDDRLRAELNGAARSGEQLSVQLLDVDYFKRYNDDFGHPAGDTALIRVAEVLRSCCRGSDSVVRYGGEEFALIMPATDAAGCQRMAERVRRAIATAGGLARPITVSIGAATLQPAVMSDPDETASALMAAADNALYRAKQAGRDRADFVILSDPEQREAS
ncbi:MAG: GGDEF domain-containing protein [Halieaceae bacterium]|jgi:diguanylate cyclase (GGDEF)-like protein|nr:GGDEF domain-containing protein [Halieaceae bacterium]